ncbi:putative zinc finger and SCAN domain-containing protein 5D [Drosophila biarmipes]|uniref:putative zinc finger and SCAN domain-containing protein 5D n=1 Tax=Drosophila biarmipes TaxID=125945 RepID=UPI0007E6A191|nr:putative zinc finger and SCAN domain-containing protein 5D [Drosophila biarmipes]
MEISIKWSMCRTCRKKGSELQSLFESNAQKLLASYAGLEVQPGDGLPDQICWDCLDRLEEVDRFLSECKRSDEHLRTLVRQTMSSAASFHTPEDKDPPAGQKKRARKQNITGRLIEEKPIIPKTEGSPEKPQEKEAKEEPVDFVPIKKSLSQEEPSDFVYVLDVTAEREGNSMQGDYTIGDWDTEENDDELETFSQEGAVVLDSLQETSEESQKSEATLEYEVDLGVACVPDKFRCRICSNTYPRISQLNVHMQLHRREKAHECEVCQKSFRAACNLKTHMRTHTGEKPYKCNHCQRRFADSSTHRKHERMHTNEKPYACNICGKSFSLSTSRKAHYLLHSSDKPHKCLICDKDFRLKHQLLAHEKTHTHLMGVSMAMEYSELME